MSEPTFTPSAEFQVAADGPRDVGIVFIGASLVAGVGDPKGQGWVSRVVGRTHHSDLELTAYNLGRARRHHRRRAGPLEVRVRAPLARPAPRSGWSSRSAATTQPPA